jgi:hypothetical protein
MDERERIAVLETKINQVLNELRELRLDLAARRKIDDDRYVTKEEFYPIKKAVYGAVALLLTLLITAVTYVVLQ